MSVLAVGTVAFDVIETPAHSARQVLGGTATYISLAVRLAGGAVRLVSVVGNDFPEEHVALLRRNGVDTSGLQVDMHGKTFAWGGRYGKDPNQRTTLFTALNVLADFDPVVPPQYRDSRILCLGNLDPRLQMRVMDQMPGNVYTVCDTMNYWIDSDPDGLQEVLSRVDCLIVNDEEAQQITSQHNMVRAAADIRAMGPAVLVIKKGAHGAMLFTDAAIFVTPAFPTARVTDPTGAGDAFLGGFCGQLANETTLDVSALQRAVITGTVIASFAVEQLGVGGLIELSATDIVARTTMLRSMVTWPKPFCADGC